MAERNAFANDGGFMARFLAAQRRETERKDGGEDAVDEDAVDEDAVDERVRASVARNDGSFLAAFLALQRDKERRQGEAAGATAGLVVEEEAPKGKEKQEATSTAVVELAGDNDANRVHKGDTSSVGTTDGGDRPSRRKRSRWDAGPTTVALSSLANTQQALPVVEDEDEALRGVRAKQQKHREELRFLEQRVRGFQQQAVASAAVGEAKKEAEKALAEERRREYARLAELAEREGDYRDTVEQAELGAVRDGTREHRRRAQEMLQTLETAAAATARAEGKHHLGDFLPKDELEKLMQQGRSKALASEGTVTTADSNETSGTQADDDEFDQYRKRMMLAYRFRPNPLNNPRRQYY